MTEIGPSRLVSLAKRLLPRSLRGAIKEYLRQRLLHRALRRLARLPAGALPDRALLADLDEGWGNLAYGADITFLEEMLRRLVACPGPGLECGSGLSTILMGFAGASAGLDIWSLENDATWFIRAEKILQRYHLGHVRLLMAPLKDYGGYTWYDPPLEEMPRDFRLVVCDGPVESTSGGRYGLLPIMAGRFVDGAVVLLDDAHTAVGRAVLGQWQKEGCAGVEIRPSNGSAFAVVTLLRCP